MTITSKEKYLKHNRGHLNETQWEYNQFKTLKKCMLVHCICTFVHCRFKTVISNGNDKWFHVSALLSVETEEAALLHEEATMTIEELLVRYGQNRNAVKHAAAIR